MKMHNMVFYREWHGGEFFLWGRSGPEGCPGPLWGDLPRIFYFTHREWVCALTLSVDRPSLGYTRYNNHRFLHLGWVYFTLTTPRKEPQPVGTQMYGTGPWSQRRRQENESV